MDFNYKTLRSDKRRNITITVERDKSVIVHAPKEITDEKVEQIVLAKRQWIYEKLHHPQKYQNLPHAPGKELISGEAIMYLGKQYRLEIVKENTKEIRFDQRFFIPAVEENKKMELLREWFISKANEKIVPRVLEHAIALGVDVAMIKIVDNRYRWGSCTLNNNVNINWKLIKAPMFVIDYVIIHELAHLLEANHTSQFWNIVRSQSPLMHKAKAWLKEHGQIIEQAL
jgi:predicted metal-dependent hydrolase